MRNGFPLGGGQIGGIFDAHATPAESIFNLSTLVFAICGVVFLVVSGLLAYTIVRFRRRQGDSHEPPQVYGSNQLEIAWTIIPILIVFVLVMATARVVTAIQNRRPAPDALPITVIGHQFWWEIRYPGLGLVTANELHVPVGRESILRLESADVAHSFWVPQLAGKTDLIPGRTNTMWIDPRQEGIYAGNCAEYCGTQHAYMLIRVVAQSQAAFDKWVETQKATAAADPQLAAARSVFLSLSCISCHTVSGTPAAGTFGPDLSHLMSRATLGSGVVANTPANLRLFVQDPQRVKRGSLMPNMQLNEKELNQVVAYLSSLQ